MKFIGYWTWEKYHSLGTHAQIKMLEKIKKQMKEKVKNNKAPKDTYIYAWT